LRLEVRVAQESDQRAGRGPTRREFLATAGAIAVLPGTRWPIEQPPAAPPLTEPALDLSLAINGEPRKARIDPRISLLDLLREQLALTGAKKGCDQGACGACTVHIDGRRVNACLTLAAQCEGKSVTTIEGLGQNGLHPVQAAFIRCDGFQCGYCTPGQVMSAAALLQEGHCRFDEQIREWMSGNICRCGAYPNILEAVKSARDEMGQTR
jgi:xanthine dehydrogenase YagT iron-sulfur-binding subunit